MGRKARRRSYSRRPWTDEDHEAFLNMRNDGATTSHIAASLNRSFSAIRGRIRMLNRKSSFVQQETDYPTCSIYVVDLASYYELGWRVAEHYPETGTCLLEWPLNRTPVYPVSHERIAA